MNREAWLELATQKLRASIFIGHGLPDLVRVSVGFPGGGSARTRIGEHWHPKASDDGISQIFISPKLKTSFDHLGVLVHELVHACVPDAGHGKAFKKIALAVGLTGKMRSTVPGETLALCLNKLSQEIGEIPHSGINLNEGRKKQTTRMIKMECGQCGYIARTSKLNLENHGAVLCPCSHNPMVVV